MPNPELSVVIPVYNEEESISELTKWIVEAVSPLNIPFEILFVDDGSTDSTWHEIQQAGTAGPAVRGLKLNRRYGKSAALQVGFRMATGAVVITMDGDLQDSPDEIPALYGMIHEGGYDLVSGWKKKRRDPLSKRIPSKLFNFTTRWISGIRLHDFNCGLKAYRLNVVKNISVYGEMHRYIPVLARWAGYTNITEKVVVHHPRKYGVTKYGYRRLITGFLDLLSVTFVTKFRSNPMHLFGTLGIVSFLVGFVLTAKLFWDKMDALFISRTSIKRDITEQPIFYLALVALIIGVQLFLAGFLAEMIAMQSLSKKEYIVSERVGFGKGEQIATRV